METGGTLKMHGDLDLKVIRGRPSRGGTQSLFSGARREGEVMREIGRLRDLFLQVTDVDLPGEIHELEHRLGVPSLLHRVREADRARVLRSYFKVLTARLLAPIAEVTVIDSSLALKVFRTLNGHRGVEDLGFVSLKVVTTAGVNFIVDAFQNLVELELMNFHAIGTGVAAEAVGDTALGTELTTEYTGNVRATGVQSEPSANIYRTVGTNTLDSGTPAITEHGILTQAATGGGTLLDRSVFGAINLVGANGDGLQSTYSFTVTSGG